MFLKLQGRRCLVTGGGEVAEGKIRSLLEAGAEVVVVAPEAKPEILRWNQAGRVEWRARRFQSSDLDGILLVVAASDDRESNARVYQEAEARGILCNAVDDPAHCHFYFPALVRRGPLQIAISTSGHSPALAQRLRIELEERYGAEYAPWVEHLGGSRREFFEDPELSPEVRRERLHELASEAGFRGFLEQRETRSGKDNR
jgi:precorrin-2 dehydrogenase/sirohydrochlorin ferrochelatase